MRETCYSEDMERLPDDASRTGSPYPKPTRKAPTMKQLTRWSIDSICPATDGCKVEPDGVCAHGHASWLLYLGLI